MSIFLIYLLILRIVHIFSGIFWVGGAIVHVAFIEPTAKATAPQGHKFVEYLVGRGRFSLFMTVSSALTVTSGALLFWYASGGLKPGWITSGPGLVFTVGSVVGVVVYIFGMTLVKPRADRLGVIGREIAVAGGPPTPTQMIQLQTLNEELTLVGRVDFVLLAVSTLAMATARYWFMV
jgi:uncharacterized membrane protein